MREEVQEVQEVRKVEEVVVVEEGAEMREEPAIESLFRGGIAPQSLSFRCFFFKKIFYF